MNLLSTSSITQAQAIAAVAVIAAIAVLIAVLAIAFNMKKAAKLFRDDAKKDEKSEKESAEK